MKTSYQVPEAEVTPHSLEKALLENSFIYGGGGTYNDSDIFINGEF